MSEGHVVDTTAKLVRMANQIARNLARDRDAVSAVADHIHAFWTVRMQEQLFAHGAEGLDPLAIAALERLANNFASPHRTSATDEQDHGCDAG
jgi:formate dehydrogenase subunit delta